MAAASTMPGPMRVSAAPSVAGGRSMAPGWSAYGSAAAVRADWPVSSCMCDRRSARHAPRGFHAAARASNLRVGRGAQELGGDVGQNLGVGEAWRRGQLLPLGTRAEVVPVLFARRHVLVHEHVDEVRLALADQG